MQVSRDVTDLRQLLVFAILAVIAQVFLLFVLSWNKVVIIDWNDFLISLLIVANILTGHFGFYNKWKFFSTECYIIRI